MDNNYLLNYPKSVGTAYVLLFFFGVLGVHRFYLRSVGLGVAYLFTLGFFGIGPLVDLFTLSRKVDELNRRIAAPA